LLSAMGSFGCSKVAPNLSAFVWMNGEGVTPARALSSAAQPAAEADAPNSITTVSWLVPARRLTVSRWPSEAHSWQSRYSLSIFVAKLAESDAPGGSSADEKGKALSFVTGRLKWHHRIHGRRPESRHPTSTSNLLCQAQRFRRDLSSDTRASPSAPWVGVRYAEVPQVA